MGKFAYTSFNPSKRIVVSEGEFDSLKAQGLLVDGPSSGALDDTSAPVKAPAKKKAKASAKAKAEAAPATEAPEGDAVEAAEPTETKEA